MGRRGALHSSIKPLAAGMRIAGSALTVKLRPGDNLMLLKALDMARPGDVLVVDSGGETEAGPWGEITSLQAQERQVAGLITDGAVRDRQPICEIAFPVFCRAISIKGTAKAALGFINHPITCGGVVVNPGDVVLGDDDGVVVIPFGECGETLIKAREREAKEAVYKERIRAGESFFALMGFDDTLHRAGCVEEE